VHDGRLTATMAAVPARRSVAPDDHPGEPSSELS
jgi:hypothetical protein